MEYAKRIELELTLRCNLACPTCSRHCNMYSPCKDTDMNAMQLGRFMSQVETKGDVWDTVAVMGGEPTLHPLFSDVMHALWERLVKPGHVKTLQMWTNGTSVIDLGALPVRYLAPDTESVPDGRIHIITADHSTKVHYQALLAPKDTGQVRAECEALGVCGIALNAGGYWPCGPAGAIARLFGWQDAAKAELPNNAGDWGDIERFCELCQHGCATKIPFIGAWGRPPICEISPTYRKAIDNYKPRLKHW